MDDTTRDSIKEEILAYRSLQGIADSEGFEEFFKLLIKTVADKMIWTFTSGKDGDNIKNWEDFCKVRGEVIARLQPIQEIKGAKAIADHMQEQLDTYYSKQV